MSKFENELLKVLDEKVTNKDVAKRAYSKAVGKVNVQLANLKAELAEKNFTLGDAVEDMNIKKFALNFNLTSFDAAKEKVDILEEEIADIEATVSAREKLLEDWK